MISLLTCGVTQAHYTWYNLSPQGKTISSVSVSIFGAGAEGLVFAYIGLCLFTYMNDAHPYDENNIWSFSFIGYMAPVIVIGRLLSVYLAYLIFLPCSKTRLSFKELTFISYGGMIRGAIAFGLVLKIPRNEMYHERSILVTSTLSLVIITTLFFGTFMNFAQKILVGRAIVVEDIQETFEEDE
jgi:NhaP-type Na+/H+ or K+/H+ antiporter